MTNITSGKISKGILGIETDVLYQWRNLVATVERKLTPISNIHLENFKSTNVDFISRIIGQEELPIENVTLKKVVADTVRHKRHKHYFVNNFKTIE